MTAEHPSRNQLRRFVAGELAAADNSRVVGHLLGGCRRCKRSVGEIWMPPQPREPDGLDEAVGRAISAAARLEDSVEADRLDAEILAAELDELPASHQALLVLNSPRFRNWHLGERLIAHALELSLSDPAAAVDAGQLGVALAEILVCDSGGDAICCDLAGRAWGTLANARRIRSDLAGADEALRQAEAHLRRGSEDPLEWVAYHSWQGAVRRDQRQWRQAEKCFDRAIQHARLAGDRHRVGREMCEKASVLAEQGHLEQTIALLTSALPMLDPERDPRSIVVAQHNLTWALNETGRLQEAMVMLQEILPLHARSGKALDRLRLRWLEGKLAQAQGQLSRAEEAFLEVHQGFLRREIPMDAALAALDLAVIYLESGRLDEMRRLAGASLPVFRALGIHREALTALALFQKAAEMESVTVRWIAELAAYLQRSRKNPELEFRPPARA